MLVVQQGQVAVMKAYVGLATEDTSGDDFKFGSPGAARPPRHLAGAAAHRQIRDQPALLRRRDRADLHPDPELGGRDLDRAQPTTRTFARSWPRADEGFVFTLDLQVQIHVPDTEAPKVISTVGTMTNLVNEVLQAAVGNHFRDKLQAMPAIDFIQKRPRCRREAQAHITERLKEYRVETRGVYIQDVVFPAQLVQVLTAREIANQQKADLRRRARRAGEAARLEASRGRADMQS